MTVDTSHRPMRADAVRNRTKVLEAASATFAERGPDASLEEIAHRAGVGIGTLYRHFPDRQSLMLALYREQLEALNALGTSLLESADPYGALREWLRQQLILNRTHQAVAASAMIAMLDDPTDRPITCEQMHSIGSRLLARAVAAGDVRDDVTLEDLARMVSAIAMASDRAPDGGCECGDRLFVVMMDGIRTR